MKLHFTGQYRLNIPMLFKTCGYHQTKNIKSELSYVRALSASGYPRFHCYTAPAEKGFAANLHLDQKKPSYGEHTAHSGEYEGPVLEAEARRITQVLNSLLR
ncbi:MAG: hypothetical protein HYY51_00500 [Candidatus Magasanikbacteria bacterium]|nr:hypothetical protein [Candidatus Magasanikbacteria bacterium]